jgi:PadR family transcriptional regulator AphA
MQLGSIGYVILGLLRVRPLSGYEIKQWVDRSTRFFWAASYGQIYPELRRLEDAGLVARESAPQGQRQRNVFRLTKEGEGVLREWLLAPEVGYEYRDLGLLKLFLAEGLSMDEQLELVSRIADHHRAVLERLREVERLLPADAGYPRTLVLEWGLALHEFNVQWFEQARRRVKRGKGAAA